MLQELVTAGSCPWGEMQYDYSGSANKKTTEGWSDTQWQNFNGKDFTRAKFASWTGNTFSKTVPSQKYAGTYEVYWRVKGDKNHKDYVKNTAHFPVTINRKAQTITFDYTYKYDGATDVQRNVNAATFCIGGIERTFAINRLQEAKINVSKSGSTINEPSLSGTTVTMKSNGTEGKTTVTVTISESANYLTGTATFTVTNVKHAWHWYQDFNNNILCTHSWHQSINQSNSWPWPDCTNNGTGHNYCSYDDCMAHDTRTLDAKGHNANWGGTVSCHTYCTKCSYTLSSTHGPWSEELVSEAGCGYNGITRYTCVCGYSYLDSTTPAATQKHSMSPWWGNAGNASHERFCEDVKCPKHDSPERQYHSMTNKESEGCCWERTSCSVCGIWYSSSGSKKCGHAGSTKKKTGGTSRNPIYTTYCDCCGKTM